jgi:acetyl-CoA carboxylase biotin carboxyl carrier protein
MPGFRLHVRRGGAQPPEPVTAPERERATEPAAAPPPPPERAAPSANGAPTIDAPMLGTFYRASGPGEQPFVDVGSQVDPDTVVCLIEVMKMMNSVKAGVSGTVVEVCASNAELVEYGEPLFRVDPVA